MDISEALKKRGLTTFKGIIDELRSGGKPDFATAEKWVSDIITEIMHKGEGQLGLIPLTQLSDYLVVHSVNVSMLSTAMAHRLNIVGAELNDIGLGALLHDIGKINTPDDLIWKLKGDNDYETTTIQNHPVYGAHWIRTNANLSEEVISIIRDHHETFDSKGYPNRIPDRELGRSIKIVAICNYYDYLTQNIPGKNTLKPRAAMFYISQQSSKTFGYKMIVDMINTLGPMLMDGPLFQKSALVMLDTREVAAIMNSESFGDLSPEIIILTNSRGTKLERSLVVNLKKDSSRRIIKILKS